MQIDLAFVLGLIQAATEFLPVSSSGHLLISKSLMGFDPSSCPIAFDIILHLATLLVVFIFLNKDIISVLRNLLPSSKHYLVAWKLSLLVSLATLPIVFIGLFFKEEIEQAFGTLQVAGFGFILTTIWLSLAHYSQLKQNRNFQSSNELFNWQLPTWKQALFVGLAQAIAILPGVSRSGSTVSAGLFSGMPAESALRFSFLLSIPAILGATILEGDKILSISRTDLLPYSLGFVTAFITGVFALKCLEVFTKKTRLVYFAIYTACLSVIILLFS